MHKHKPTTFRTLKLFVLAGLVLVGAHLGDAQIPSTESKPNILFIAVDDYYPNINLEELYDHDNDPNEWDNVTYKKVTRRSSRITDKCWRVCCRI